MEPTESQTTWRCPADALAPGQTAAFELRVHGRLVRGLLVNHHGGHHAYVNRCPHAGTPLDAWPNEFFTEDGRYLVITIGCLNENGHYDPAFTAGFWRYYAPRYAKNGASTCRATLSAAWRPSNVPPNVSSSTS